MSSMQANLKEYTGSEIAEMGVKCYKLRQEGKVYEADELQREVPILAALAQQLKEDMGIQALIKSGANLSKAVKIYGSEWLHG